MTTTKFPKGLSIGGKKGGTTDISGVVAFARASFNPTSASQVELFTLPKGAIPMYVVSYGGATGGTNPTVDVGTVADNDGLSNELDADTPSASYNGALLNVQITADTTYYGKVGASAATGGTTSIAVAYIMADIA